MVSRYNSIFTKSANNVHLFWKQKNSPQNNYTMQYLEMSSDQFVSFDPKLIKNILLCNLCVKVIGLCSSHDGTSHNREEESFNLDHESTVNISIFCLQNKYFSPT